MPRSVRAVHVKQNPFRWFCRWIAGTPLNGAARTNASFLHPATKNESGYFWSKPWHRCEQWKVAVVRIAIFPIWSAVILVYAFRDFMREDGNYHRTFMAMVFAGAIVSAPFIIYWIPRLYDLRHYRSILSPIAKAIGPVMGMEKTPAGGYIDINRRFVRRDDNSSATIRISHALAGQPGNMRNIEGAIRHCLAANEHELKVSWLFSGPKPTIYLSWAPAPPELVPYSMVMPIIEKLSDSEVLLGMARAHRPYVVNIDQETPHLMLSVGSGGGKSETAKVIASQLLHKGAQVYIADIKRISHIWAKSVRGVRYARDIADIHDMFIDLSRELDRRNTVVDGGNDAGRRLVVIVEEMNMLIERLKSYWSKIRERGDPKSSPAIASLAELLFAGRAVKIHVVMIAQYLTANAAGGTAVRENLGLRGLGRYSPQSWKTLAGDVPMPPPSRKPGRMQFVIEGVSTEVQAAFFTDQEAIDWAQWEMELVTPAVIPQMNGSGKPESTSTIVRKTKSSIRWEEAEDITERLPSPIVKTNRETSSDT